MCVSLWILRPGGVTGWQWSRCFCVRWHNWWVTFLLDANCSPESSSIAQKNNQMQCAFPSVFQVIQYTVVVYVDLRLTKLTFPPFPHRFSASFVLRMQNFAILHKQVWRELYQQFCGCPSWPTASPWIFMQKDMVLFSAFTLEGMLLVIPSWVSSKTCLDVVYVGEHLWQVLQRQKETRVLSEFQYSRPFLSVPLNTVQDLITT